MNKNVVIAVLLTMTLLLPGCGGDKNSAAVTPSPILITALTYTPVTVIPQFRPSTDILAVAPGMANYWDIDQDFSIFNGGDYQFLSFLALTVGATGFPFDQLQSELTYSSPLMGASDGAMAVSVSSDMTSWYPVITGTYSAFLYPTGNSILQQTVVLSAATGTVTLSYSLDGGSWAGNIPGGPDTFRIVVRNSTGAVLRELDSFTDNFAFGSYTADLTAYRGQTIALTFEHQGQFDPIVIDDVSMLDSNGHEFIKDGGFESGGLASWTTNTAANLVQNLTSGSRTLEGLDVTRSFYTVPNKLWGRWVDVFSNPTGSDIATTISYFNQLGSEGYGIIYTNPSTTMAITSWDGGLGGRDIGFVFGLATSMTFTSDDGLGNWNGSSLIPTTYDITVPAGGEVAIVNFIIMSGTDTGLAATDTTARATEVDAAAAAIASNFWTDPQYRNGMTQAQINAISNF